MDYEFGEEQTERKSGKHIIVFTLEIYKLECELLKTHQYLLNKRCR